MDVYGPFGELVAPTVSNAPPSPRLPNDQPFFHYPKLGFKSNWKLSPDQIYHIDPTQRETLNQTLVIQADGKKILQKRNISAK